MKSNLLTFPSFPRRTCFTHLRHYGAAIGIFLLGTLISFIVFNFYQEQDQKRTREEFDHLADIRLFFVKEILEGTVAQLDYGKHFFDASPHAISKDDFHSFFHYSLTLYPNLRIIGWAEADDQTFFKTAEPTLQFSNLDRLTDSSAFQRFPMNYEAWAPPETPLTISQNNYPDFLAELNQSRHAEKIIISRTVDYLQNTRKTGFFLMRSIFTAEHPLDPIQKKQLKGTLIGFSSFEDIFNQMSAHIKSVGINIDIFDVTAGIDHLLASHTATVLTDPPHLSDEEQEEQEAWSRYHILKLGNRIWKLNATPTLGFIHQHTSWKYWEVLIIGMLISGLTAFYFLILTNQRILIEHEVEKRTEELTSTNQMLENEIHERHRIEDDIIKGRHYLQKKHEALEYLTKFTTSELQSGINEVIFRTASVLEIDRVSIWFHEVRDQIPILSCKGLYILSSNTFSDHLEFSSAHFPHYFQDLESHTYLIIPSPTNAEVNQELASYLTAFHIISKLDIPIVFEGRLLGVLCCEETRGHREWLLEDRHFGQTIADVIALMIEQSARRKAEKALQQSETRLIKAIHEAKAASDAKTEFLTIISHELRTPLNAIIGFVQCILMGMDGPLNDQQQATMQKVEKSSLHLLTLINDLLDLSKIEANKMELESAPHDIVEIIHSCVEDVRPMAEQKQLPFQLEIPLPHLLIEVDKMRIRQVLLNLLSNAIKFTKQGSITVRLINHPHQIEIHIIDTGIGLTIEELAKIFRPFAQADSSITRKYGGTGLGLVISKKIIDLHGGKITVKSKKDGGSTFIVTLRKTQ